MTAWGLVLASVLVLAGCSFAPSDKFIEAMGKDSATVSVRINTIYGTAMYCRTAIQNGDVSCNADGISVRSQGTSVGVPLTIIPNVQMGQPTTISPPK